MTWARYKAPAAALAVVYQCASRVVDKRYIVGDVGREPFVLWMYTGTNF